MSHKPMRPLEARLALLRAAKSPGCGCGHAHPTGHGIHGNHGTSVSQGSVDSAAGPVVVKEAA